MKDENLAAGIRELALKAGADMVGFADLHSLPPEYRTAYPFGISMAVALDTGTINRIRGGPTKEYHNEYLRVNKALDAIGEKEAGYLRGNGYRVVCIPATSTTIDTGGIVTDIRMKTLSAQISHKMIATRAGLGWVGKSDLLVTRHFGSAVRIITVLTDAALPGGEPINDSGCGDCHACVDACPARAITGTTWYPGISRESLVDVQKCMDTGRALTSAAFGEAVSICGVCIAACPWTRRRIPELTR
jgi:epoxyqueuosine reductase QueG